MSETLRVATFNLESLDDSGKREADFRARLPGLRAKLLQLEADVLCLQEVNAQKPPGAKRRRLRALDRLLEGTPYARFHRVGTVDPTTGALSDVHNLVLLSRFPILATRQILHDLAPPLSWPEAIGGVRAPGPVRWERPLLYACVDLGGGRRLHVLNVHLRAPRAAAVPGRKRSARTWGDLRGWAVGLFASSLKRVGQALEARLLIEDLFDAEPDAWLAVCGDFNADEHELPLRLVKGDPDDVGNPALAGRLLTSAEDAAADATRYSVVHGGRRLMLDHILVSPGLARLLSDVRIENRDLADEAEAASPGPGGSFHAPVAAAFSLPAPETSARRKGGVRSELTTAAPSARGPGDEGR